jgi:hypothetical protein
MFDQVKRILQLTSWSQVRFLSQLQSIEVLVVLSNFRLLHNSEFRNHYAASYQWWNSSSNLVQAFGEVPSIFTSRMMTEENVKESLDDLHRRIAFYLNIKIPQATTPDQSSKKRLFKCLSSPSPAKRMRLAASPAGSATCTPISSSSSAKVQGALDAISKLDEDQIREVLTRFSPHGSH